MERDATGTPFEIVSSDVGRLLRDKWRDAGDDITVRFVPVMMYASLQPAPNEIGSIVEGRGQDARCVRRILVVAD